MPASLKSALRSLLSLVSAEFLFKLAVHSIVRRSFAATRSVRTLDNRHALWDYASTLYINKDLPVTYVEFGVWKGESINYFASRNNNDESIFVGLDSFEGLPEDWGTFSKGTFDTGGAIPEARDERIVFVKGWFQQTWDETNLLISGRDKSELFVHYDADLYSSTLFALTKIDSLHKPYYALFDEFYGQESRALYDYIKSYDAEVEFLAKTENTGLPNQVLCKITPKVT